MTAYAIATGNGHYLRGFTWTVGGKGGLGLRFGPVTHALKYESHADASFTILIIRKLDQIADPWKVETIDDAQVAVAIPIPAKRKDARRGNRR